MELAEPPCIIWQTGAPFVGLHTGFIRHASQMSYQQLLIRRALDGETIEHFMNAEPITVPDDTSVQTLIEDYFCHHHHKLFPVTHDGRLVGCVTLEDIKTVPPEDRKHKTVGQITNGCSQDNTVTPDTDAMDVLSKINQSGRSRMLVVDGEALKGIATLKDLLHFLALKIDLDQDVPATFQKQIDARRSL